MVSQGISSNRLIAKGFGETQMVNQCVNGVECSEAAHQMNRRTEFVILKQ
jgi:outer membrane protein OmpA-like peptidoglycan-associated protein